MYKLLLILLFTFISSITFALTATITQTVTPTITIIVNGEIFTPTITATVTLTPLLTDTEIQIWRDKLNPIKPLKNVKTFINVIGQTYTTDLEVVEYVKVKVPIAEVIAVKTFIAKPTLTSTPTKAIVKVTNTPTKNVVLKVTNTPTVTQTKTIIGEIIKK